MRGNWRGILQGAVGILLAAGVASVPAIGKRTAQDLYKSKCQICHGDDGSPTMAGKALGARDLRSAEVQKQTDAQLAETIAQGKNKMPAYGNSLARDQITDLVAYIRALAEKR